MDTIRRLALCATLSLAGATAPAGAAPPIEPALAARAAEPGGVPVLVELAVATQPEPRIPAPARAAQRARIAAMREALRGELGGAGHAVARAYRSIPFVALEVGPEALATLRRSPRVRAVHPDPLRRPSLDASVPIVQADQAIALGFDGAGAAVAVLDTGVDVLHPNLAGKLVAEACFASGTPGPQGDCPNGSGFDDAPGAGGYCTWDSDCFHGTHVAGIAVGSGPAYSGVAQGAGLISIQVFSEGDAFDCAPDPAPCSVGRASDLIAALEHVYDVLLPLHPIAAVNLSLGGASYADPAACDADNPAEKAAIDNLRAAGVAVAAAAGNDGVDGIHAPGCISSAVSVGAVNDLDVVPAYSNSSAFLSLWAPGHGIRAPRWQSIGYTSANGTSMATPHVAGAFAILRQARPEATVAEMLAALQATGVTVSDPYATTTRIRIRDALDALPTDCSDALDNDGDGLVDSPADPGCESTHDLSESSSLLDCDDGADNDGDGDADAADPACLGPLSPTESPACDDGLDNDGDGGIDWDGAPPDPQCADRPWRARETANHCGLGWELAPVLVLMARARRRSTRTA
jgi:subtilisin family serine protease